MQQTRDRIGLHWVLSVLGFCVIATGAIVGIGASGGGVLASWLQVATVVAATALGTAHGTSVVAVVFRIADPPRRASLDLPGSAPRAGDDLAPPPGTMRGGAMIGVLERAVTIVALAAGQPAVLAAVIAVKAIGRFGELDGAIMRERFLVGSLASIAVASAWGLAAWLVVAPGP